MTCRSMIIDKILRRVKFVQSPEGFETMCFQWTGPTSGDTGRGKGYPRMALDGQTVAVHRVLYTHFYGYVPGKKQIDHKCRNRLCLNPVHLEMVTHKKNQKRKAQANAE